MDMYNEFKLKEDYVVDIELLRFERLIEEREAYEKEFFSLEPPTDDFEYMISQYLQETEKQEINFIAPDFEEDLFNPFELEDLLNQLRDEKLIEEREKYEENYFSICDENLILNDSYELQIAAREEEYRLEQNELNPDFDYEDYLYEEEMFYHLLYLKESQFAKPSCRCVDLDYIPNDDGLCDYLDCYDYPEGPDENLCGIKYC